MRIEYTLAILVAIGGVAGTALLNNIEQMFPLGSPGRETIFIAEIIVVTLAILNIALLLYHSQASTELQERPTLGPAVFINLGVCLIILGFVWHFSPGSPGNEKSKSGHGSAELTLKEITTWNKITSDEYDAIQKRLKGSPPKTIAILCDNPHCQALSIQLTEMFRELHWNTVMQRVTRPTESAVTGFYFFPNNDTAALIEGVFKSALDMPTELSAIKETTPSNYVSISILAKPLPAILPLSVKLELAEFGTKLIDLSRLIIGFADDRARSKPSHQQFIDPHKNWEEAVEYRKKTDSLFSERFGTEVTTQLAKLSALGIALPFQVKSSAPGGMGRFLGVIGNYLQSARIDEARANARNDIFWFDNVGRD